MKNIGRRGFLKAAAAAAFAGAAGLRAETGGSDKLRALSHSLLREWCGGLERLQIKSGPRERLGGIKCPACDFIHGRIGDAVYPFLSLAKRDGNSRMLDAGMMLYGWMENNVSQPDGSWINDFSNPWKGTSVFGAISLAEAVKHCGGILEKRDLERMRLRLGKAALFIASFIKFGRPDVKFDGPNINYLAAAAHALALSAEVLDDPKLMAEARKFGRGSVKYITPKDRLVFGETQPTGKTSPNGCKGVDLGYNVEETLPSLAGRNPRLYTAALRNLELLESCTENGLLCGGPHFRSGGIPACIHHTFAHAKPLASLLDSPAKAPAAPPKLPREERYGVKSFDDIRTHLVSKGPFRATVTAYDTEYYDLKNGHPTGGALSMLWHEKAGPIFAAGMTEYAVIEKPNMQSDAGMDSMPLAPRAELDSGGKKYRNISDLSARLSHFEDGEASVFEAASKLRDACQNSPDSGEVECRARYEFRADGVAVKISCPSESGKSAKIIFPLIASSEEKFSADSPTSARLEKKGCRVKISSDRPMKILPTKTGRVFNFVPGFEAVPICVEGGSAEIKIEVA